MVQIAASYKFEKCIPYIILALATLLCKTKNMEKKNIFLLHGENTFASSEKLKQWQTGFSKKYGEEGNIEIFDIKDINMQEFETNFQTLPFLCEKRFLIIKNATGNKDKQTKLSEIIEKTPDFCILIFHESKNADKRTSLYKKLKKIGQIEEFLALDTNATTNWILKRAEKEKLNIGFSEASYLAQFAGTNQWRLSGEIKKLKAFTLNNKVTKEDINSLIRPSLSTSIFNLTDSIAQKRTKVALQAFKDLMDSGEEILMIFHMIVRQFRLLIIVKSLLEQGLKESDITKKIKQHPFVVKKTVSQSHNFSIEQLKKIHEMLVQIEIDSKSGKIKIIKSDTSQFKYAIERIILTQN